MRVLMRESRTFNDRLLLADNEYDVDEPVAKQWIRDGRALEVVAAVIVKALAGAPENKAYRRKG